jgi:hypothetical protein
MAIPHSVLLVAKPQIAEHAADPGIDIVDILVEEEFTETLGPLLRQVRTDHQ